MMSIRRRAYTLLETVAVLALVAIVSGIAGVTLAQVSANARDTAAQQAAQGVAGAQEASWRTYGKFTAVDELDSIESAYTYVSGTTASTGPRSASVALDTTSGREAVGVAVLGESGTCYTVKRHQPRAPRSVADSTGEYTPNAGQPCTGAEALKQTGEAW